MKNCSTEIRKFHNAEVRRDGEMRDKLRDHAYANEDRLKKGLDKNGKPQPEWFVIQGSYAMRTTAQHPNNDYDIDDGAVFSRESLKGGQGSDKTALAARQMVCDALNADPLNTFAKSPEVRTNCVRVYYKAGYHVDIPVYRVEDPQSDDKVYELAGADWKKSSPEGVTEWFDSQIKEKKHDEEGDKESQLRRLVRLLKKFAISRESWNMPSGFILTALTVERFVYYSREDEALYNLFTSIHNRLSWNGLVVGHPVLSGETITKTQNDACMEVLKEKLSWAIEELSALFEQDCTKKKALKQWGKVFNTNFFDDLPDDTSSAKSFAILTSAPKSPVQKEGGGRFG